METITRIMLADDHALIRSGLKLLLGKRASYEVVGEAADGMEALRLYKELEPDILILDISLPRMDGIQVLKEIKFSYPEAKIIVLTMHEDEEYINAVIHAGASGYVPKAAVDEDLYAAIETVLKGYTYLRPQETHVLLTSIKKKSDQERHLELYRLLSAREKEILDYLTRGYSLVEIAQKLVLSVKTVDTHKSRLMIKLNVTKKSELIEYVISNNLQRKENFK
ncbi:response regulator transcription factor [Paenibacillus agilis]|uniref:Response regulator transcription factor n=1 Tax=Paenibacillus agilis TaxID=3020863 RepID=A0A559IXU9_9BACL|nr:response regulator transcription factor [Paenibacillus agilis]TVX92462.1 response regulator transcription factor [Paenibacillus agilis]